MLRSNRQGCHRGGTRLSQAGCDASGAYFRGFYTRVTLSRVFFYISYKFLLLNLFLGLLFNAILNLLMDYITLNLFLCFFLALYRKKDVTTVTKLIKVRFYRTLIVTS